MRPHNPNHIHAFRETTAAMRTGGTSQRPCPGEKCRGRLRSIGQFIAGNALCKICRTRLPSLQAPA